MTTGSDGREGRRRTATSPGVPPFQSFLEEQRTIVYRFLLAAVGPAEADDCFQETFLSALRAYPRLSDARNLRSWVLTIATRKAIDAGRDRARRPVPNDDAVRETVDRRADAEETSLEVDASDPLWSAVRKLPPRQRAALVHRHVLDRSYGEIAELMGSSEETARANVFQGMRKLRTTMEAT
jgi:RNA polymerase sigma factor (sigma-70 family)